MLWNKEKSKKEKEIRMPPVIKKDVCIGCGACVAVCPHQAISLKDGKAVIDKKKCKDTWKCVEVCPVQAIVKK